MSIDNFIPEVWASGIQRNLHKVLRFAQPTVCNRNYEGEIKEKGDTVRITSIGGITISDYAKNTDLAAPQAIEDSQTTLTISQAKYFNFSISDVDKVQGNPRVMDEALYEAAYAEGNVMDGYVAGLHPDAGSASGSTASPKTLSVATDAYPLLVSLKVNLDQLNVPDEARWCVVPSWFQAVMLLDDRFIRQFEARVALGALLNGQIGYAAGFNIMVSNNCVNTGLNGDYKILAGHPSAITFAEQVNKTEAYRPHLRFDDAVKGLTLYGAKVTRPDALTVLTVTRALA